ncbi:MULTISPECIES: DUF808 domain-containing protein [Aestuariimicrobium]|uniref:DUF808 domain-containing protein n=1 Tax=Aestuariimicrobium TaxID=396388 RepID=UPI0003B38740|nr:MULTISPECIES: DUF808 domain-containing protein [Aestuariimicrobium]CAI9407334.1 Inner membrane protein YedI [Aestuariimicrobium sp. T2.26MG-19.2B]
MSGGLAALLDDIAAMAKMAAASLDDVSAAAGRAGTKAAGVVIDDTAVTPRYVTGVLSNRELPMIMKIARGSLVNKLLIILPIALVLSQWAPWLLTPILMLGGTYLSYEGVEKLWEKVSGHQETRSPAATQSPEQEKTLVNGAIRTDLILSAEIMVISLNEVAHEPLLQRSIILVVVGIAITVGVYGVVAVIVKMDDIGVRFTQRAGAAAQKFGRALVEGMPVVLAVLSTVGIIAMLWVGGHILLVGADEIGWHAPYALVHHAEQAVHAATGPLGGVLGWLTNTAFSFIAGVLVGAVVVAVVHVLPFGRNHGDEHEVRAEETETAVTP